MNVPYHDNSLMSMERAIELFAALDEEKMDAGELDFVLYEKQRYPVSSDTLEKLNLATGQTVDAEQFRKIEEEDSYFLI